MKEQGLRLLPHIKPALEEYFGASSDVDGPFGTQNQFDKRPFVGLPAWYKGAKIING